jgi:hypothetical protein
LEKQVDLSDLPSVPFTSAHKSGEDDSAAAGDRSSDAGTTASMTKAVAAAVADLFIPPSFARS